MTVSVLHHVDDPSHPAEANTPVLIVRGWCVDLRGDTVVAVEAVRSSGATCAPVGLPRPDVGAALGHRPGSDTSGFCFWISSRAEAGGTLLLRAVHRDGTRTELRTLAIGRYREPSAANPGGEGGNLQ